MTDLTQNLSGEAAQMVQQMLAYRCPRYDQLPAITLYSDQVTDALNYFLSPLWPGQEHTVTAAMINNYVKMKRAPPAEKKKYDRAHMARFLMICLMKKVLSMAEIAAILEKLLAGYSLPEAYDLFCLELESRLHTLDGADGAGCPDYLATTVRAVACKIAVERLLSNGEGI